MAAAWLAGSVVALATPVIVPDFSFENTAITPGGNTAAPDVGTNWTASGNGGVYIQDITNTLFTPTGSGGLPPTGDGTNYLVENMNGHTAYCWQNIGLLQSNTIYTLTIAVGQTLLASTGTGELALVNGTTPFGTILASTPVDNSTQGAGTFTNATLVFTNGYVASGYLTILMEGNSSGAQLCFDNVHLDATAAPAAAEALLPKYSTPSATVYQGTLVTLSENPAGALPFHYQWQTDNGSGGASFSNIAGANSTNVVVDTSGFTPNQPVEYVVIVTNAFGASTSAPVVLTAITGVPVILVDTLPASDSSDVVGSDVTFTASFDGSRPIYYQWEADTGGGPTPISGATNATLTVTDLQLTDTGYYSLIASNALGLTESTASYFTVYAVPAADANGVVAAPANQVGLGGSTEFTPTWELATGSLIAGELPSSSVGNFQLESAGGIVPVTDGSFGPLPPEGNAGAGLATCGIVASGAGSSLTYTLPASTNGFDLTNIVVYGGWSDNGRDEQDYEVFYSTVGSPTNFQLITIVDFLPTVPSGLQSATRVTLTSTNGVLAKNVAAVQFYFNYLAHAPENQWEGYAQFQVFGGLSQPRPFLVQNTRPATGSDVTGSQVTFNAAFTSSLPLTYQWFKDGAPIAGATSTALTLTNLQLSDTAVSPGYSLQASNTSGTAASSPCPFTVNQQPSPDTYGIIVSPANQTGSGRTFTPTWPIAPGSLISGQLACSAPSGDFALEGAGGIPVLTDGQFGSVGSGINVTMATCGGNAGKFLTYCLAGSATGYDLTNLVVFGGWSDGGRDQQAYNIYYSTVENPTNFVLLDGVSYLPTLPGSVPSATRVTLAPGAGGPLASNVVAVMFDFTTSPSGDGENGYEGYAEIQLFGSASAGVAPFGPAVLTDTLPGTGSDVVGSQFTFRASFTGTAPLTYQWQHAGTNLPGATSTALTLSNLQLAQSGAYNLVAANAYGTNSSTPNSFTVNPVPAPVNGVIVSAANQLSFGLGFSPTWSVAGGSLIAGAQPSSVGSGSFVNQGGAGGLPVLTDGQIGSVGVGNIGNFATCGTGGGGNSVTYTLSGSAAGYNLTEVVTYGGWGDAGRDQQAYTVSYSTVAAPGTFVTLASVSYLPSDPSGYPSATRMTCTSSTSAPLATSVAAVEFDFTTPSGENGWEGYSELQLFGVSATPLEITSSKVSGGKLILTGTGGTPGSGYTVLTATNVTIPLAGWTTNVTGVFDGTGAFSNAIPILPSEPSSFFRIRIP
ncbi:Immunoglobulin I-set domain protein [Verrucomicrobia bacterium]|nr:Immunoglobulin I-set domain protein [Verrucomicrobiota bacterium]